MSATIAVLLILLVAFVVFIVQMHKAQARKRLLAELTSSFGKPPAVNEDGKPECLENIESINRYAEYIEESEPTPWRLDATTWNDLDMDKVFGRINICRSSIGEEYLYNCLHELQRNDKPLLAREKLIQYLGANPDERVAMQMALSSVGKENFNGLVRFIFDANERFLKYKHVYTGLSLAPLLAAAILLVHVPVGFFLVLASFIANIAVHHKVKNELESDMPAVEYLHGMLVCCKRLCAMRNTDGLPVFDTLREIFPKFKSVMHRLPASQNKGTMMDFDFIVDYVRIAFLMDVRNFNKLVTAIKTHNRDFHGLFKAVGEIETAICVLNFRKTLPVHCTPTFTADTAIIFEDLIHPLLNQPVANDGEITVDSLLTGSNASGKSTFVKALALGGVLAQTLYTCAATRFTARFSWILTSMTMRDDIYGGDSYFIVEIKSLRRIVDRVREHPCTCYIDEILRGTNTVERIAASASMLTWLHKQNCLCIAATHDIELTHLLAETHENYHFREQVTTAGVVFDYKLKKGPSTTRNAIKLLEVMDFAPEIVSKAQEMAKGYDEKQKW
ncbi:MAG: hypothetical protein FWC16_11500 [Defluviitaleaceae bacterium]|nr:hypothetical protein [Defluviitaleaceae bacterium]MCL2275544.1 hypothetical protein [Defluviitaleaceae bacterium]